MKIIAVITGMTALLAVLAFVSISLIDVPVEQSEVVKTVSNDRFYSSDKNP
ncbi:MAG: hypothetical protein HYS17_08865 [Micavibrio aeruginosavorus]|uniref:Uncharacterized protein n=1 Tax=Micavibrio aeruginosavorus TaxID=349221 RepID=A0A7T5R154_9BACT|nr:MAG: hypothetical protein HYS17_08865 [Micavibrio aeruginosavorus]